MHEFLLSALGGVLIGLAAVGLMVTLGRVAGVSGIAAGVLGGRAGDRGWRLAFVLGLVIAPALLWIGSGDSGIGAAQVGWPWMALAGLLVGIGTRLGSGCTSGHGVCGIARLSPRSLLATGVFVVCGVATVAVVHRLLGVVS